MKELEPLWHLEVAPLTSIPLTRGQFFTYASSVDVTPGSLVSIPVTSRILKGIVFASHNMRTGNHSMPRFTVKRIQKVIQERFMTPEQLKLAEYISTKYYTSLGRTLVHFVPQTIQTRKTPLKEHASVTLASSPTLLLSSSNAASQSSYRPKPAIIHTTEQLFCIQAIAHAQRPQYLFGPASSGKTEVYIQSIKALLETGAQVLVLVPELTLIPQEIHRYSEVFGPEHVAVIHSHVLPSKYYDTWKKIAQGQYKVILGTRQALFAPFTKLKAVIVDEEQDDAYKQWDMSPRYDGRTVAEELARIHGAKLVFGSATPSIERYYRTQKKEYDLLTLSPLPTQPPYEISLVNMRFERHNKNFSSLSEELTQEITRVLKNKRQVFLFINRQGGSACTVCASCNTTLRCVNCNRALVFDIPKNSYACLHCPKKDVRRTTACQACGAGTFKNIGYGTQLIEKEIKKRFPYSTVARIDRQSMQKRGAREAIFQDFASGKVHILIGTQMATKGWDLPNVALVGMIDADSLFALPDFKADEHAYQHILQAAGRMARIGSSFPGKALIQTYYPENPTLLKAQTKDFISFYEEVSEQRELLRYPPFGKLIRIIIQNEEKATTEKLSKKIHKKIVSLCENDRKIRISEPAAPMISLVRNQYRQHIILRLSYQAIPQTLHGYFLSIAKDVNIDIDPIGIL